MLNPVGERWENSLKVTHHRPPINYKGLVTSITTWARLASAVLGSLTLWVPCWYTARDTQSSPDGHISAESSCEETRLQSVGHTGLDYSRDLMAGRCRKAGRRILCWEHNSQMCHNSQMQNVNFD